MIAKVRMRSRGAIFRDHEGAEGLRQPAAPTALTAQL
jgi:hypothetical protein